MTNEELLKKIEEAKASGVTVLDLSNKGITALPPEIGQLTNLTELHLSGNQLSSLPPEIGQLTNLTELHLWNNQLSSLPSGLFSLTSLTTIDLSGNQLTTLPPEIGQLTNLKWLILSGNPIISPPSEIARNGIETIRQYFAELEKSKRPLNDVVKTMLGTEGDPYSPEAKIKIQDFSTDYRKLLVLEAARLARREGAQQLSITYVEVAKERLRSIERRNWKKKLYGPVGGGFLGIGLPILISFFSNASQVSPDSAITCALSLLVGTVLLMLDALT